MLNHNLTFAKYIDYCIKNKIVIPSWFTGSHFMEISKLYVSGNKLEACKYVFSLSKKFMTNSLFDLRWAKIHVIDVFDLFRINNDVKVDHVKINTLGSNQPIFADISKPSQTTTPKPANKTDLQPKNFDKVCRGINWKKMAKARQSVKALRNKKTAFDYLSKFLDELADVATETHRIPQNVVHPSGANAKLVTNSLKNKN